MLFLFFARYLDNYKQQLFVELLFDRVISDKYKHLACSGMFESILFRVFITTAWDNSLTSTLYLTGSFEPWPPVNLSGVVMY